MGWDAGHNSTMGPSRALSSNIVQSTRVGGVTFVKNKITTAEPVSAPTHETNNEMNDTETSAFLQRLKPGFKESTIRQRMNNSRHNKSQPVMKR